MVWLRFSYAKLYLGYILDMIFIHQNIPRYSLTWWSMFACYRFQVPIFDSQPVKFRSTIVLCLGMCPKVYHLGELCIKNKCSGDACYKLNKIKVFCVVREYLPQVSADSWTEYPIDGRVGCRVQRSQTLYKYWNCMLEKRKSRISMDWKVTIATLVLVRG